MSLPSPRDYYLSAQSRSLVCCNPSNVAKPLVDKPIQSLLGSIDGEKRMFSTASQWVNVSLKSWLEVIGCFRLQREVKLLSWPAYDPAFKPALLDSRFRQWVLLIYAK